MPLPYIPDLETDVRALPNKGLNDPRVHTGGSVDTRAPAFSDNDLEVIRARHFGWERASFADLGRIFGVHPNTIRAICKPLHDLRSQNPERDGAAVSGDGFHARNNTSESEHDHAG